MTQEQSDKLYFLCQDISEKIKEIESLPLGSDQIHLLRKIRLNNQDLYMTSIKRKET